MDEQATGSMERWAAGDRYERIRCIGRGGHGVVYEVFDHLRKRHVALKTLAQSTPTSLLGFKQEFGTLAELRHPNLVHLYELVCPEEGAEFFTMELVIGHDFRHHARKVRSSPSAGVTSKDARTITGHAAAALPAEASLAPAQHGFDATPANIPELRSALVQLVAGLRTLHHAGKLHRDIKPSNVMVSTEGRLVILDFGLSTGLAHRETSEDLITGTPVYMAPEQVTNDALQPASDWYAVGVLLFDALVGRAPFQGSLDDVMQQKLSLDGPRPSQLVSGIPSDLDELCTLLLTRDPVLRPTGKQIAERLRASDGSFSLRPAMSPPTLFGRQRELETLQQAFDDAREHGPAAVLVHGPSGIGKSALLAHFAERLTAQGRATVLMSRVYEQESIPYKAVDAIMDQLSQHLERAGGSGATLTPAPRLQALGQLFPVLRRLAAFASEPSESPADPLRVREQAFEGLRLVLESITRDEPMLWLIDDVQWGDSDSASLLVESLRTAKLPLLLVLSCRERLERPGAFLTPLLRQWPATVPVTELAIGALSQSDVHQLLSATLAAPDDVTEGVAERVFQMSTGNPFLAQELAEALVPSSHGAGTDVQLSQPALSSLETVLLDVRLRGLDDASRRLLEIVATSGRAIGTETAAEAAGVASQVDATVGSLAQRRVVRTSYEGGVEVLEVRHDRIRDWILSRLSETQLRELHRRLARALEATPHTDTDLWIEHWLRSGDGAEIRRVAVPAAARAAERLALGRAQALYRAALPHVDSVAEAIAIHRDLARVLEWDGRGADAADAYLRAAELTSGFERSTLESTAGLLLIYAGRFNDGARLLRASLRELDLPAPQTRVGALLQLVVGRLRLSGLEQRLAAAPRRGASEAGRARVEALHAAAFGFVFTDALLGECSQVAHLRVALEEGTEQQLARALALEASQRAHRSLEGTQSAEQLFQLAAQLARRGEDPAFSEFVQACRGVSQFLCGNWCDAHDLLCVAYRGVPRHTAGWHSNAWIYDVLALCNQGRFDLVAGVLPGLLEAAVARADRFTETTLRVSARVPLLLAGADPAAARAELEAGMTIWDQPKFLVQHWRAMWWSAEAELYDARPGAARERYLRDAPRLRKSFLLRVQYIRGMTAFVRARCALSTFDEDRKARGREVSSLTAQLESEGRRWTTALAAMLDAALTLRRGDLELGVAKLRRAFELTEQADMSGHAQACRWLLAELLAGAEGLELRASAEATLTRNGVRDPERYARSLLPV